MPERLPRLTAAENRALFAEMWASPDPKTSDARRRLIEGNRGIAGHAVGKFTVGGRRFRKHAADLRSVAFLAVIKAVDGYKAGAGAFSTYATRIIKTDCSVYVVTNDSPLAMTRESVALVMASHAAKAVRGGGQPRAAFAMDATRHPEPIDLPTGKAREDIVAGEPADGGVRTNPAAEAKVAALLAGLLPHHRAFVVAYYGLFGSPQLDGTEAAKAAGFPRRTWGSRKNLSTLNARVLKNLRAAG